MVAGLHNSQAEVHRAAREGTVNSDQLWGLSSRAGAAVCLGVDMCGAWMCMVGIGACNKYARDVMVTVENMADDLGSSY